MIEREVIVVKENKILPIVIKLMINSSYHDDNSEQLTFTCKKLQ